MSINRPDFTSISLTRNTVENRISDLSTDLHNQLKTKISSFITFSIAIDESTDIMDVVSLFVRYVSRGFLRQELLALLPLKGQTRGEDLVGAVVEYFETNYIPLNKIVSISTDGAESMLGSRKGFITLIKRRIDHEVITLHCIIHQEALSAQTFKDFRKEKATLSFVINPLRAKVSNLNLLPFEINAAEFEMQLLDLTCKELWASKFIRLSELLETLEQKHCLVKLRMILMLYKRNWKM
ncbi:protein FAM200A-like [Octopus sinensis]|uniref:Protein FAM200A-like n=1 Tax=Octopus sinensis TaxID=2607531 RepID=A0A6P7TYP6_9MOLL|nr:protein FAM200A-like [Octopus sinensis]